MWFLTTRSIAIGVSLAGFAVHSVLGWGAAGHEIVATLAQIYTEPSALERICQVMNAQTGPNLGIDNHMQYGEEEGFPGSWTNEVVRTEGNWPCHLASIATWADRYKYRMRWSAPLHYVGGVGDHPADLCLFPGSKGWEGKPNINILGGIFNTSNILLNFREGEHQNMELAQEALKFLVHFMGDLHMPLHLTGRDRGGNSVQVCWDGRRTNLHSVWDGFIIAKAIRQTGRNYSRPLPGGFERVERNLRGAIYDGLVRRIVWEGVEDKWAHVLDQWNACPAHEPSETVWSTLRDLFMPGWFTRTSALLTDTDTICPYHWAKPIHALNCELIWPKMLDDDNNDNDKLARPRRPSRPRCKRVPHDALDSEEPPYELDNPEYTKPIEDRMLLEQFLAQGGVRLAAVLNHIFAD